MVRSATLFSRATRDRRILPRAGVTCPDKPSAEAGSRLAARGVVSTLWFPSETDPDQDQPLATNEHQSRTGRARSSASVGSSMPLTDALLLFLPEEREGPVVADFKLRDPLPREVRSKPEVPTVREPSQARLVVLPVATRLGIDGPPRPGHAQPSPHRARVGFSHPAVPRHLWRHRAIAWVDGLSRVRTLGLNIGFICGIAVSALGMWLFNVPPAAQGTMAARDAAPALTMLPVEATAPAESVSRETPAPPTVDVVVPSVSTLLAPDNRDQRDQADSRAAARPLRQANPPGELSATDAPLTRFTGTLAVHSSPPGARVFVGGTAVGTTPIVLTALPVGSRVVRLEAEGYQIWSSSVRVIANQQTQVTATLYREPPPP